MAGDSKILAQHKLSKTFPSSGQSVVCFCTHAYGSLNSEKPLAHLFLSVNFIETFIENGSFRGRDFGPCLVVFPGCRFVEAAEGDMVEGIRMALQKLEGFANRDATGVFEGEAVDSAAYCGKGNGSKVVSSSQFQARLVARGEKLGLVAVAAVPDRAHRVDYFLGGQVIAVRYLRLSRLATTQGLAFLEQTGPGGSMNGPVHSATTEQSLVGGIDDGIDLEEGEIALHDRYFIFHNVLYVLAFAEGLQEKTLD